MNRFNFFELLHCLLTFIMSKMGNSFVHDHFARETHLAKITNKPIKLKNDYLAAKNDRKFFNNKTLLPVE